MYATQITAAALLVFLTSPTYATLTETSSTPEGCDTNLDLLFIIDSSESILDEDPIDKEGLTWSYLTNFAGGLARRLPVGSNSSIAAIRFGSRADVAFYLNEHRSGSEASKALSSMKRIGGNTNTAAAFRKARLQIFNGDYGARAAARNVVVFIGDGISNKEVQYTDREISLIKDHSGSEAEVFAVGISTEIMEEELKKMCSFPVEKHFLHAPHLDYLPRIQELLLHRICRVPDPVIPTKQPDCLLPGCKLCDDVKCHVCLEGKYLLSGKCEDCIANCQLCSDAISCERCIRGWYWEPETGKCEECQLIADLALVVDNSGSIRDKNPDDKSYDNYRLLKEFLVKLLDRVDVGPNATRVGAIKFSTTSQLVFGLADHEQRDAVKQALLAMGYSGGHTNISGALRTMRERLFVRSAGDRPDVGDVGLVITDGESTVDDELTETEARLAKLAGITLFVVGVTDEIDERELKSIASEPVDEHYFNSTDIRTLDELLHSLTAQVCAQKPVRGAAALP